MKNNYLKFFPVSVYTILMTGMVFHFNKSLIGIDDANIYMVYMRNFAHGHGFVYNINSERVEGFTSLLWTLIGAFFYLFIDNPELLFLIINIIIITYSLWRLIVFIDRYYNEERLISPYSILFLGLLTVIPGYFEWTILSYLETGLWSSLLILTTINILEYKKSEVKNLNNIKFNILIILLVLCRPESLLWGIVFIMLRFYKIILFKEKKTNIVLPVLIFFLSLVCLTIWRFSYFGFIFPNTYYAKVTPNLLQNIKDGFIYLVKYMFTNPLIGLVMILSLWTIYKLIEKKNNGVEYIIVPFVLVSLSLFIPLYTGGDHFAFSRFIQPTVPIIWLLLIIALKPYITFSDKKTYSLILLFLIAMIFVPKYNLGKAFLTKESPLKTEWDLAKKGRENSIKLNQFFSDIQKLPSQGVIPAGGMAYTYYGKTIDLLGLNNVAMAHSPKSLIKDLPKNHASFNKAIFYQLNPDVVWLSKGFSYDSFNDKKFYIHPLAAKIVQYIFLDKKFNNEYIAVVIYRKKTRECLSIFASKVFLKKINENYLFKKYDIKDYSFNQ